MRHDFTRTNWGHDLNLNISKDRKLRGFVWLTPSPKVGDELIWRTGYGKAVGVIRETRWTMNVDDMYEVTVEVTKRIEG
jgi:hypothetical protein